MLWTVLYQLTHHRELWLLSAVTSSVQLSAGLVSCCSVSLLHLIVAAAHLRQKNWGSRCRHKQNYIKFSWEGLHWLDLNLKLNSFYCMTNFNPIKVTNCNNKSKFKHILHIFFMPPTSNAFLFSAEISQHTRVQVYQVVIVTSFSSGESWRQPASR